MRPIIPLPDLPLLPRENLLDMNFLALQLDTLGPAEMIGLARLFQRTSRQIIDVMDAAAAAGDRSAVKAQAHRLRSAAGALCLVDVARQAARIEADAPLASQTHLQARIALLREARGMGLRALGRAARTIVFPQAESIATPKR